MSAARYNLVIDQGSDFAIEFTVSESGTGKNLTNYYARAFIRPSKSSSTKTDEFNVLIPDSTKTQGIITMSLTNQKSAAITAGTYFYDLEIFTASDVIVKRLIEGQIVLSQSITRD
mgnify:CR=1 FL=1